MNCSVKSFNFSIRKGLYPPPVCLWHSKKDIIVNNLCMNRASLVRASWTSAIPDHLWTTASLNSKFSLYLKTGLQKKSNIKTALDFRESNIETEICSRLLKSNDCNQKLKGKLNWKQIIAKRGGRVGTFENQLKGRIWKFAV